MTSSSIDDSSTDDSKQDFTNRIQTVSTENLMNIVDWQLSTYQHFQSLSISLSSAFLTIAAISTTIVITGRNLIPSPPFDSESINELANNSFLGPFEATIMILSDMFLVILGVSLCVFLFVSALKRVYNIITDNRFIKNIGLSRNNMYAIDYSSAESLFEKTDAEHYEGRIANNIQETGEIISEIKRAFLSSAYTYVFSILVGLSTFAFYIYLTELSLGYLLSFKLLIAIVPILGYYWRDAVLSHQVFIFVFTERYPPPLQNDWSRARNQPNFMIIILITIIWFISLVWLIYCMLSYQGYGL